MRNRTLFGRRSQERDGETIAVMSRLTSRAERPIFVSTASATVGNTVNETSIVGTGVGSMTLPADYLTIGKVLRITVSGYYSTKAAAAGTLRVRIKLNSIGAVTILDTGASTMTDNVTNAYWSIRPLDIICRNTGALTGEVIGQGQIVYSTSVAGGLVDDFTPLTAAVSVNTTLVQVILVTVQWGTADAGNTITSTNVVVTEVG